MLLSLADSLHYIFLITVDLESNLDRPGTQGDVVWRLVQGGYKVNHLRSQILEVERNRKLSDIWSHSAYNREQLT